METQTIQPIPLDRQQAIIINELDMWHNTRYQLTLRFRVNSDPLVERPGVLKEIEAELIRCERAIDILKAELDALTSQLVDARNGLVAAPNGKVEQP